MASETEGYFQLIIDPIQLADILRFFQTAPDRVRNIARPKLSRLKREIEFETKQYIPIMLRPHSSLIYGHAREGFTSKMGIAKGYCFGAYIRWKYKGRAAHKGRWIEFGTKERWAKTYRDKPLSRPGLRGSMPAFGSERAAWTGHAYAMRIERTFNEVLIEWVKDWGKIKSGKMQEWPGGMGWGK